MVIVANGERCTCGRKGCWEAYASATALIRQTKAVMEKAPDSMMHEIAKEEGKVSGKTAFVAAKRGDRAGQDVVDAYINYIGEGLVNLANIFIMVANIIQELSLRLLLFKMTQESWVLQLL